MFRKSEPQTLKELCWKCMYCVVKIKSRKQKFCGPRLLSSRSDEKASWSLTKVGCDIRWK